MSVIVKVGKGVLAHVSAIGAWPVLTCTNKAHADHEKITFSARRTCPEAGDVALYLWEINDFESHPAHQLAVVSFDAVLNITCTTYAKPCMAVITRH
jgi:hypothetical protein